MGKLKRGREREWERKVEAEMLRIKKGSIIIVDEAKEVNCYYAPLIVIMHRHIP